MAEPPIARTYRPRTAKNIFPLNGKDAQPATLKTHYSKKALVARDLHEMLLENPADTDTRIALKGLRIAGPLGTLTPEDIAKLDFSGADVRDAHMGRVVQCPDFLYDEKTIFADVLAEQTVRTLEKRTGIRMKLVPVEPQSYRGV